MCCWESGKEDLRKHIFSWTSCGVVKSTETCGVKGRMKSMQQAAVEPFEHFGEAGSSAVPLQEAKRWSGILMVGTSCIYGCILTLCG